MFEDSLVDPDRETRQKIRAVLSGSGGEQQPAPSDRNGHQVSAPPVEITPPPAVDPLEPGATVLPSDWREKPLPLD